MFKWLARNIDVVFVCMLVLTILSPFLFTRSSGWLDFSGTGEIGDTIGGLTAPFISLLSVVLLYLTLKEQIETNRENALKEVSRKDYESLIRQAHLIKEDFEALVLHTGGKIFAGNRALFEIKDLLTNSVKIEVAQIDEASIKAFALSYNFLVGSIHRYLMKNHKADLSYDEKRDFYDTVMRYKPPVLMVSSAANIYISQRKKSLKNGEVLSEIDKTIELLRFDKPILEQSYKMHEPEKPK